MFKAHWEPPPARLLKLNFDGNFIREANRGWGGITRDNRGQILSVEWRYVCPL